MRQNNFKYYFASVFLVILFIGIFTPFKSYSQFVPCPDGWVGDLKIVPVVVGNDTCLYEVGLCLKCDASTHLIPLQVMLTTIRPLDTMCIMDPDSAAQFIISKVYDPNWIFENLQNDCIAGWGPCELKQNWVEVDAVTPKCFHWELIDLGNNEKEKILLPCGTCKCNWSYYICWDANQGEFIQIPNNDKPPFYSGDCPCDADPNSGCFSVHTNCD